MNIRAFTPTQERGEDLERRTVGRDVLLHTVGERLRIAATTRTRQHTLLIGPRGSGKTHLLQVALYRASRDPGIADGLAVAQVPEDAVGLTNYVDLLRELADHLGVAVGRERDTGALERLLLAAADERTLVVVIENLDRVFRSIGLAGQRNLRSWVETSGRVMILASSPALFESVRNRAMPWFGGLIETPVDGLDATNGRELLTRLARERGDSALVDALQSDRGRARIQAISELTAGSPRIWMVLSDCLSVESLDELIPAVEGLVERLVPYYQSLLWDLADNHQAIVRQLAEGGAAAMTASEIAAETGLSQQTVSKALGLLNESRWVRAEKMPGGDQRLTFYSLREPMLRHHFQWRATQGEPLRLVVGLLREWYDPTQLRWHLSRSEPASPRESYLAESLRAHPPAYDLVARTGSPDALLCVAREWMRGEDAVYPPESGLYAEICVNLTKNPAADVTDLIRRRCEQFRHLSAPSESMIIALASLAAADGGLVDLLLCAASGSTGDVAASLTLIAAGLLVRSAPARARRLLATADAGTTSPLGLAIRLEYLSQASAIGEDPVVTLQQVTDLVPAFEGAVGSDDALTLAARSLVAYYTGETGDAAEALVLYRQLQAHRERVLGPDDRDTLAARMTSEHWSRIAADRDGVIDQLARARAGDQAARIRLPVELRRLTNSDRHATSRADDEINPD